MAHCTRHLGATWPLLCRAMALGAALAATGLLSPAQAGLLDVVFGQATAPAPGKREWVVRDFMSVRLVPREAGAVPNHHPQTVQPDGLRQALAQLRVDLPSGPEPLFAADELAELIGPLTQALATATPEDDLLLLSAARRRGGIFDAPTAITARLFFRDGALQMLLADSRQDFYNRYIGSRQAPEFRYGTRAQAGRVVLRTEVGSNTRADWVALPTAAAVSPAAPLAVPLGAAPSPARATPPASTPAAPPAARTLIGADEAESRLTTLKRLRERGLLSEDEYQQKRKEILSQL